MIKRTKKDQHRWPARKNEKDQLTILCQNSQPELTLYPESLDPEGSVCKNWVRVDHIDQWALCWQCVQRMVAPPKPTEYGAQT